MRKLSLLFLCLFFITITAAAQKTPVKHADGAAPVTEEPQENSAAQGKPAKHAQPLPGVQSTRSYSSGRFSFEIDGVMISGVEPIEGIDELLELARTRPGNHKPGKMTVTKDWSNTSEWYKWRKAVLDGKTDRRSISVIFHNDAGEEAGRLNFHECWPTDYTEPDENARSSGHAQESITLVYENFDYKK